MQTDVVALAHSVNRALGRPQCAVVRGDGNYTFRIVGEADHQLQIQEIVAGLLVEGAHRFCAAFLVPLMKVDDPYSVRVQIKSLTVGHLPRNVTQAFSEALQRVGCLGAACRASVAGGTTETEKNSYFRVRLDAFLPFDLLRLKE